jgi:hemerythrin
MSLIEWDSKKFSVHVDEMDEQHKKWIHLINVLHDSLMEKKDNVTPKSAIEEMLAYTRYHFAQEEALMRNIDYPAFIEHKQLHGDFIVELQSLNVEINTGHILLRTQIMSILKNWLEDHITTADMRYGEYISKTNA